MSPNPDPNASTQDGNNPSATTSGAGDTFTPITSQEDLDKALGKRLERERSKFADYADLQAKAKRLDEIEEANKSELEKERDRAAAAEAERDKAKATALRLKVATEHGISTEDAELFLTGADEDTLTAQAKRLADRETDRKRTGARAPREGAASSNTGTDGLRDFARGLFGSND